MQWAEARKSQPMNPELSVLLMTMDTVDPAESLDPALGDWLATTLTGEPDW